ncbi:hypothetical protein QNO00_09185 [Arthrobacter sp. zg-Y1219]|uniref:hypothetical protein n=1 Tax=Arthrobacter sp. zg-Y1219 TaxID=3049067 RepID=UPI0024C3DF2C|nr:hypothetical protein [Arthrobacter sp. zg-Y1219]MDK1360440.1 hypothetical protein [Arthrobacter sp. zg-Y1219]
MFRPPYRSLLIVAAAALALTGCGDSAGSAPSDSPSPASSSAAPSSPAATSLTVEFSPKGTEVQDTYTLECEGAAPAGSSAAPDPAAACEVLAAQGADLFAPPNPNLACTQMIAGPQRAQVSGTLNGESVDRGFSLANGCEIGRWESLAGLLGPAEGPL